MYFENGTKYVITDSIPEKDGSKSYFINLSDYGRCPYSVGASAIIEKKEGRAVLAPELPKRELISNPGTVINPPKDTKCQAGDTRKCGPSNETGICAFGTETCNPDGTWGGCTGAVMPLPENCSSNLDNNCDGIIDSLSTNCPTFESFLSSKTGGKSVLSGHYGWVGYKFSPLVDVYLAELCKYSNHSEEMMVINSTYDLIVSAKVDKTPSPPAFACKRLSNPPILNKSKEYYVLLKRNQSNKNYYTKFKGINWSATTINRKRRGLNYYYPSNNSVYTSGGIKPIAGVYSYPDNTYIFNDSHREVEHIKGIADIGVIPV